MNSARKPIILAPTLIACLSLGDLVLRRTEKGNRSGSGAAQRGAAESLTPLPPNPATSPPQESRAGQQGTRAAQPKASPASRLPANQTRELVFERFQAWADKYLAASDAGKTSLEAEGVALADGRLNALADLIQTDPERALKLAVAAPVRRSLPASVQALLEDPVHTRADYQVICVLPIPGSKGDSPPILRFANINGEEHQIFTYGRALSGD